MINQCKELLEQAERAPAATSTAMAELQRVYDKYQKIYGPRRQRTATKTSLQRDMISEMIDAEDKAAFEQKWMDRLDDVDRELDGDNHRKEQGDPVLGRYSRFPIGAQRNNYLTLIQKPYALFQRRRKYKPLAISNLNANMRQALFMAKAY